VVVLHSWEHLRLPSEGWLESVRLLISFFPGVPIFFVISGLLISRSWERSRDLPSYARNRFIRIYPALWVAFLLAVALAAAAGFVTRRELGTASFWGWVIAQLSVVQFYNPSFLRGFGVGVINGSLWTIPVELAFYAFLPFFYRFGIERLTGRGADLLLAAFAAASFAIFAATLSPEGTPPGLREKLLQVTLLPHLFMFLFGVAFQRNLAGLSPLLEGFAARWTLGYVVVMVATRFLDASDTWAYVPLVLCQRTLLALTIVACAYTSRESAERWLRGNDISYGVYLYHMLVVNGLVYLGASPTFSSLAIVVGATLVLAAMSWKLVEEPALRHKRRPMRVAG
jgi:peptidoglycan/LPS O-acetylase OafA/YrhL